MGVLRVLMPYNFSVRDSKALDFVVDAFAQRKDVKVTIFHSQGENVLSYKSKKFK